jgi:pimeloyl-ACP methyl ester carboxylesterase
MEKVFLYGGVPIMHFDSGQKNRPVMVFVHGLGANLTTFEYVSTLLDKAGYRVCGLDMPGFGLSGKPFREYTMDYFSGAVLALMDHLGIASATLCGHSLGGLVCANAALRSPSRVENLIMLSPAGVFKMPFPVRLIARKLIMRQSLLAPALERNAVRLLEFVFGERNERTERFIEQSTTRPDSRFCLDLARVMSAAKNDLTSFHLFGKEEKLEMPTLVIWGGRDRLLPFTHVPAFVKRLPDGELEVLERCGHMSIIEDPDAVAHAAKGFLQRASAASRARVSRAS